MRRAEALQIEAIKTPPRLPKNDFDSSDGGGNKRKEGCGGGAWNSESLFHVTDAEIKDDLKSYLGEYRFKLQKYDYKLALAKSSDGIVDLCDPHRFESMSTKARRAIEERKKAGLPTHREEAEEVGISNLKDQLRFAKTGDRIFWASPPGPKEEGYGDYGYLFSGKVGEIKFDTRGKPSYWDINMTAIRVENPTLKDYNLAMSSLSGVRFKNTFANDFLENPIVTRKSLTDQEVQEIIVKNFVLPEEEKEKFDKVMKRLESQSLIDDLIKVIRTGTREEKIKAFYTLENYALKLKSETILDEKVLYLDDYRHKKSLQELANYYGYKPPTAYGSCGSTDSISSNNLISMGAASTLVSYIFGFQSESKTLSCKCPFCEQKVDAKIEHGKITCPNCKSSAKYSC